MKDFCVNKFIKNTGIIEKHPEIFHKTQAHIIKKFINRFEKYTKNINADKNHDINKILSQVKHDFKTDGFMYEQLQLQPWNEQMFKYCANKHLNDVYVFPENKGPEKIIMKQSFYTNCIKLKDIESKTLTLINRNGHMMISAKGKTSRAEIGKYISFKILFIYNYDIDKWIITPFKLVSHPYSDVNCDAIALSATTDDSNRQYNIWIQGLRKFGDTTGILNLKFVDKKYIGMPNLFGDKSSILLDMIKSLVGSPNKKIIKRTSKKIAKRTSKK
jgi:hypothetical protein